jgi:hypothetical protein
MTTSPYFDNLAAKMTSPTFLRANNNDRQVESKGCEVQLTSPAPSSLPNARFPVTPELRDVYRTKDGKVCGLYVLENDDYDGFELNTTVS